MTRETFEYLLDKLDGESLETLKEKNAKYSAPDDALHNFNKGAEFTGLTPAQTAWGYLTKHLIALHDKIERDDFEDKDDLLEKCQDAINYIRFIWCLAHEGIEIHTVKRETDDSGVSFFRIDPDLYKNLKENTQE